MWLLNVCEAMNPIEGYRLIAPDQLTWRPSNLTCIPYADYLERTGSEILGARLAATAEKRKHAAQACARKRIHFVSRNRTNPG